MSKTITINQEVFDEMLKKKEELDAIIESIELINNPKIIQDIRKSKEDIKAGRIHNLREILKR